MADIQLRFGKDMLVIGGSVTWSLASMAADLDELEDIVGADLMPGSREIPTSDAPFDTELSLILEPEVFEDAFQLEKAAGAQCLVAPTANLTPARLAHTGMRDAAVPLAEAAVQVAHAPTPEHVLVELAPCGLPLDVASKSSLMEHRVQYERAARLFADLPFDAFFLNGFTRAASLKCALMGIRKVSDAPILASVDVDAAGVLRPLTPSVHPPCVRETVEDAVAVMAEFGAQVAGFCTDAPAEEACALAQRVAKAAYLPVMAQLFVRASGSDDASVPEGAYAQPDALYDAALALAASGVQFVRAAGQATPAHTGALAAAVAGRDVGVKAATETSASACGGESALSLDVDALGARLRAFVNDALGIGGAQ